MPGQDGPWTPGRVRLFASHLSEHKVAVAALAEALDPYGFSTFVAHEAIDVTAAWRAEIAVALNTCDCMLVFSHPRFHESDWTDQEVGWALGRAIPIIVLMYPDAELKGFLEQFQAFPLNETTPASQTAAAITQSFVQHPSLTAKVIDGLVTALSTAPSYFHARDTAETLDTLSDELRRSDMIAILRAFQTNDQVGGSIIANRPLRRLVEKRAPDMVEQFWPRREPEAPGTS